MKPILECKGLSKKYNNMNYALTNLNLALAPGQIVGLLGPNGSGKSTLIKLINDLLIPTEGEVLVDGMTPGVETKKIVSYLPERTYLDPAMKIRDIISYFADFYENFVTDRAYHMTVHPGRTHRRRGPRRKRLHPAHHPHELQRGCHHPLVHPSHHGH